MGPVGSWSTVADAFTAFLAFATLVAAYLLVTRLPQLTTPRPLNYRLAEKRRRYGAYAVGVGLVILMIGVAGNLFRLETGIALGPGETATITDAFGDRRQFTSQGVSRFDVLNRHVVGVALQAARDGKTTGLITSEERQYVDSRGAHTFNPSMEPGIDYSLKQDIYVVLTGVMGDRAQMRIAFNPLVSWVWIGGAMIAIGGAVAMWPS
jgi:cytochrome c-type biogenesis protein CcmF